MDAYIVHQSDAFDMQVLPVESVLEEFHDIVSNSIPSGETCDDRIVVGGRLKHRGSMGSYPSSMSGGDPNRGQSVQQGTKKSNPEVNPLLLGQLRFRRKSRKHQQNLRGNLEMWFNRSTERQSNRVIRRQQLTEQSGSFACLERIRNLIFLLTEGESVIAVKFYFADATSGD